MHSRRAQILIRSALDRVNAEIAASTDQDRLYARGLAREGYMGGYADALNDVLLLIGGDTLPARRRWWEIVRPERRERRLSARVGRGWRRRYRVWLQAEGRDRDDHEFGALCHDCAGKWLTQTAGSRAEAWTLCQEHEQRVHAPRGTCHPPEDTGSASATRARSARHA